MGGGCDVGGSQRGGTAAGAAVGAHAAAIPATGAPFQGWDLYREVLNAVCLLVTDPHPQVASCAAAVLRLADCELTVQAAPATGDRPPCIARALTPKQAGSWHLRIGCRAQGGHRTARSNSFTGHRTGFKDVWCIVYPAPCLAPC